MYISKQKREKISEQILAFLYSISPKPVFTIKIAQEVARDEEFVKSLLLELKQKKVVVSVNKNPKGTPYKRRLRWQLSEEAHTSYKGHQSIY